MLGHDPSWAYIHAVRQKKGRKKKTEAYVRSHVHVSGLDGPWMQVSGLGKKPKHRSHVHIEGGYMYPALTGRPSSLQGNRKREKRKRLKFFADPEPYL